MVRKELNKTLTLKRDAERCVLKRTIVLMMVFVIALLPPFLVLRKAEGWWLLSVIVWFIVGFGFCMVFRYVYLRLVFKDAMAEFKNNKYGIDNDIKYCNFFYFKERYVTYADLVKNTDKIISMMRNDFLVYSVSLVEGRVSIFIFGIILGLVGNGINNYAWHICSNNGVTSLNLYVCYLLAICALLLWPWYLSRGILDRFSNKKSHRELIEYLELLATNT